MSRNTTVTALLAEMGELHDRKNEDYANASNPYENFERAATLASWFTDPVDRTFATLLGVKLARLGELGAKAETPNFESTADSHLDLATYAVLWAAYRRDQAGP